MSLFGKRPRGPRDRPLGYYPRRTSLGLFGLIMLSEVVPTGVLQCLSPVIPGGVDLFLGSIPYFFGLGVLAGLILTIGLRGHRYWFICLYFYYGVFLLAAYVTTLLLAVIVLLGAFPLRDPGFWVMSVVALIILLAASPFAWFVLRALRLRYWQPGSAPETWEPGNETPPAWALSPSRRNRP